MEAKAILWMIGIAFIVMWPIVFLLIVLPKLKPWATMVREWRLNKIRKYALKYIDLLDRMMKREGYPRQKRRQFWREFISEGRFIKE